MQPLPPAALALIGDASSRQAYAHANGHGLSHSGSSYGNGVGGAAAAPHSSYHPQAVPAHVSYAAHAAAPSAAASYFPSSSSSPSSSLVIQVAPVRSPSAAGDIRSQLQSYARANGHDSSSSDDCDDELDLESDAQRSAAPTDTDDVDSEAERLAMPPGPPSRAGRLRPRSRALAGFYLRLNRFLDVLPSCLDACMRGLGPALVLAAWLIFAGCSYVYFHCIVPAHGWSLTTAPGLPITAFALSLLFQVYYNHIMAVITPPGGVPKDWPVPSNIAELIREEAGTLVRGQTFSKYCKTCLHPKAARMHHCHVCRRCVSRMDHHCPWIGGCVGFANYRYFYNFLVWLWLGCLFLMSVTLPLIAFPTEAQQSFLYARDADGSLSSSHEGLIFFVLVLTAAAACAVGALLALHSFLVLTNQTTIEMYANGKKRAQAKRRGEAWFNLYDLGWRRNWTSVLGAGPQLFGSPLLLASLCSKPLGLATLHGNGLQYEINPSMSAGYYSQERGHLVQTV